MRGWKTRYTINAIVGPGVDLLWQAGDWVVKDKLDPTRFATYAQHPKTRVGAERSIAKALRAGASEVWVTRLPKSGVIQNWTFYGREIR